MAFTILIHGVQTTLIGFASRYQVLDLTNSNDKLMFLSYQQCFILGHSASSTNTYQNAYFCIQKIILWLPIWSNYKKENIEQDTL